MGRAGDTVHGADHGRHVARLRAARCGHHLREPLRRLPRQGGASRRDASHSRLRGLPGSHTRRREDGPRSPHALLQPRDRGGPCARRPGRKQGRLHTDGSDERIERRPLPRLSRRQVLSRGHSGRRAAAHLAGLSGGRERIEGRQQGDAGARRLDGRRKRAGFQRT